MARLLRNTDPALRHGWHPVALAAELGDAPLRVRLLGEPWVVARLGATLTAFADRCPHRFAPLSAGRVEAGELVCAYHGWRFDSAGACTAVPALGPGVPPPRRARADPAWGVAERHGLIWIAPARPVADLIGLPDTDQPDANRPDADQPESGPAGSDALLAVRSGLVQPSGGAPRFDAVWLTPTRTTTCAGLLADNFLDTAHFPFVHAGTIGADEDTLVRPYQVRPDGRGFLVRMEQEVANPEDTLVATGHHPLVQRRWSTYAYQPPFMLRLHLEYPDAGTTSTILFCLQPEDIRATRVYTLLLRDDLGGDPTRMAAAAAFEQAILDEDLALQERFDLDGLPVPGISGESSDEVHIRADAAGVALRRALADLADLTDPA
ncbi:aromatic ring-hydroxylating dioxygenase subunit alpha [Frankia sp. AiPa1]|uniref:aromatic ring-hydroxylating oxygenase subunit alpha n=1 Tax=Frankia sp. AiPa1 TaxID=573492 RepID=UPI00202B31F1|nr:aromatic ring-hydroxylating dioxygenase subunit alpha [Frankia sp. AiPa1]MCL9762459.1 aromatic ring-hydroxylating dioxygenase subunit alpha [Frankia sp. AiPa1]